MWADLVRDISKDVGRRHPGADRCRVGYDPAFGVVDRVPTADLREIVNACSCLEKADCPWRFLPKEFGPWQTVRSWHDRFRADVQVSTRDEDVKGFKPSPVRWRIEGTFGTLPDRFHRLTRISERSFTDAGDALTIADCRRLIRASNS